MSQNTIYDDGTYLLENPTWHQEDSPWKAEKILKILRKNAIPVQTLAELGCGGGGILSCLAEDYGRDVQFAGYEISPQAFDICSKKEKDNLHFFLKDLLAEDEAIFDVVMAIDVFEHVEDYFGFLRKLKKKGQYKVFHIPLDLSVQSVLRGSPILNARSKWGHIHYFTKETALESLKDAGYELVDYCYTSSSLELPNLGWKANLMRLPRMIFFWLNQDLAVRVFGGFSLLVLAK